MRPNATHTKSLGIKLPIRLTGLPESGVLLGLDVSSTGTGWASYRLDDGRWLAFGLIRPKRRHSALVRIDETVARVLEDVTEEGPDLIVMEYSGGKTAGRLRRKAVGLQVLGQAQGEVRRALKSVGYRVETVDEGVWTNRVPKPERGKAVRLQVPAFARSAVSAKDTGNDTADACGLILWRLRQVLAD